jgi:NAD+ synthase
MQTDVEIDPLRIDAALVTEILVRFIRAETYRTGRRHGVVGLSGGIDSSVVTYLAVRALGPDNVLAVTMPYKTSSQATRRDSAAVIERLGVRTIDLPITEQVDAYFAMLSDATQLRRANKSARERMTILYDQSAEFQALVLGTSNKSELLLGYGTQFGDMASAINPIGDLYKTQLYPLAEYLQVPASIRDKEPTGDLWVGQTDAGELGFSYQQVDRLLYQMIDRRMNRAALLTAGFDLDFTDRVGEMVRRNHYKRRLPVIAKLSHRTMDRDFRYARDWGT